MSYSLGIDVGTTYTGVAIARDGRPEIFPLGHDRPTAPTIVVVRETGEILVGEAAERRAATEPNRVAREFKRRVGDPSPIIVGGTPYGVDALFGHVLHWVYERVVEQEGGPPAVVTLTHPASWAGFKQDVLRQAARLGDLPPVELLTEPQAAALRYATEGRLDPGAVVAVYDFGGGTFDAALVRSTDASFELLGEPEGMERLGGIDFDQAVFAHVDRTLDGMIQSLDSSDPAVRAGLLQLRTDCRLAKEALSTDTDTVIPVLVPGISTDVRLTRTEFEAMIKPRVVETIDAVRRTLRSADLEPDQTGSIVLVGGSSRIPLVAQVLREEIGWPVALDSHPKFTISLGAALHPWRTGSLAADAAPTTPPITSPAAAGTVALGSVFAADPNREPAEPSPLPPESGSPSPRRPAWLLPALFAAGLVAAVIAAVAVVGMGGGKDESATTTVTQTATPTAPIVTASVATTPETVAPSTNASSAPVETSPPTVPDQSAAPATTPPTAPPTAAAAVTPSPGFTSVNSFDGILTVEVPTDWFEIDTSAFVISSAPTAHVSASADLDAYIDTWTEPGVTVALADPAEVGSAQQLMAAVGEGFGYDDECDGAVTRKYNDGRVVGLQTDWTNCGGAAGTIRMVTGTVDNNDDWILLAGVQALDPADLDLLDHVIATLHIAG